MASYTSVARAREFADMLAKRLKNSVLTGKYEVVQTFDGAENPILTVTDAEGAKAKVKFEVREGIGFKNSIGQEQTMFSPHITKATISTDIEKQAEVDLLGMLFALGTKVTLHPVADAVDFLVKDTDLASAPSATWNGTIYYPLIGQL